MQARSGVSIKFRILTDRRVCVLLQCREIIPGKILGCTGRRETSLYLINEGVGRPFLLASVDRTRTQTDAARGALAVVRNWRRSGRRGTGHVAGQPESQG